MSTKTDQDWDLFYLRVAREYAKGSKDPSTKVAALLVGLDHRLRSAGFNNFEKGADDSQEKYLDREQKYLHIKHAEEACLDDFPHSMDNNFSLYVYPFRPCLGCAEKIVKDGRVKRVISTDYNPQRWTDYLGVAQTFLESNGVEIITYNLGVI